MSSRPWSSPARYASDRMRVHGEPIDLIRDGNPQKKAVAMICRAGWVGVCAGVVDGNLITSRTPRDLPMFFLAILERISRGEQNGRGVRTRHLWSQHGC